MLPIPMPAGPAEEPDSSAIAKVVEQYALTSANDFPQRDPRDWRLLGSNDGGRSWTTLDQRKGELFSERHQRRLFHVAHPAAFNMYRLAIERVRDPAAADCVQLAELEPLGKTEDDPEPSPFGEDLVTVQGENRPVETRGELFDGRITTKWLDYAAQDPVSRSSWVQWQYRSGSQFTVTNLSLLGRLGRKASHGYPIRLECRVAGHGTTNELVWLFDGSTPFELRGCPEAAACLPGQPIQLSGSTAWVDHRVQVDTPRLRKLGTSHGQPKPIVPQQPLLPGEELFWAETEGKVQFLSWSEDQLLLELEDNGKTLGVRVLGLTGPPSGVTGNRARVRGLCAGTQDLQGERIAGTLWAAGPNALTVLPNSGGTNISPGGATPSHSGSAVPLLTHVEQIRRLSLAELIRGPTVKLRGVVTEWFGSFIQENNAGLEIWLRGEAARNPPTFGSLVELEGKADWAPGHGPVVRSEHVVLLGPGKLPEPERCNWSQLASGRTMGEWVEVEGVVRATDGSHLLLTCEGGQFMATIRSAPAPWVRGLVDTTLRVRGVSVAATDARGQVQGIQLLVPSDEYVEVEEAATDPFTLPARPIVSLLQVRGAKELVHRVKVQGVLTFREGRKYFLQDRTGGAMALGQQEVVLNSPASGWSWMFWQSPPSTAIPTDEQGLEPGDLVQVVGFPETQGYSPVLTEVRLRKLQRAGLPAPVRTTVKDILSGGVDSTLVSLDAVVLRQQAVAEQWVLDLQAGERIFQAVLPGSPPTALPSAPAGAQVRVSGVCQIEPVPFAELGKRVASFKVFMRGPADLLVLARPPWWTFRRVLVVTGSLAVVLAFAAAWIGILRRQVSQRTLQLQQEITEHEKTEVRLAEETRRVHAEIEERKRMEAEVEKGHKQLLQTSRLAGMAEVATNVLHNVGNVLNSVNVLASLIDEQVQRSKVPSVARLGSLLREHQADLGGFLTQDERGRRLPGYVEKLANHLALEQGQISEKSKALAESLSHIKEIVAMQQNYAKVSGLLETVSLAEIAEDALRMHDGALARHEIRVVRDYQPVPPVTLDRHKVLQILFNLLENAKYACEAGPAEQKQVTVRVEPGSSTTVRVSVSDNGVGIPAENLPRLFDQQFSTREGGHGFGLHSSILAAQDMGATLKAFSSGPGTGATFTLEVPAEQA